MKRETTLILGQALRKLSELPASVKVHYAAKKNLKLIAAEEELIRECVKPEEAFLEYERARLDFCRQYAERHDDGKPVIVDGNFQIRPDMRDEFNVVLEDLALTHADAIEHRQEQIEDARALLSEDCSMEFATIPYRLIPDSLVLSAAEADALDTVLED
jgi:hypothetical protein